MALSDGTVRQLGKALAPEVIDYIYTDDRWSDTILPLISDAIIEQMGQIDSSLTDRLSLEIYENLLIHYND